MGYLTPLDSSIVYGQELFLLEVTIENPLGQKMLPMAPTHSRGHNGVLLHVDHMPRGTDPRLSRQRFTWGQRGSQGRSEETDLVDRLGQPGWTAIG